MTKRHRPLPKEMLAYARSDTRFLLFIYDNLRNALVDRASSRPPETSQSQPNAGHSNLDPRHSLLREVLSRSEETSLRLHQTEDYDAEQGSGPGGWDTIARKWNKATFTKAADRSISKSIYLRIHDWRDRVAREEDESTAYVTSGNSLTSSADDTERRYILPQHYLFQLAEQPPNDLPALLNIFRTVPPFIKGRANELLDEIRVGGSKSADINGPRKMRTDSEQNEGSKPMKDAQGDVHSESDIFSAIILCWEVLIGIL
jgi:exosome complex exonuclease RRP6